MDEFACRRKQLVGQMDNASIAIIPSATQQFRNSDSEYLFRQDSSFYYLTGFCEPNAICVLLKEHTETATYILFNQPKDLEAEIWTGQRMGQVEACEKLHADKSYPIKATEHEMPKLLKNKEIIYYPIGYNENFDAQIIQWLRSARSIKNKIRCLPEQLRDIQPIVNQMRLIKSPQEISFMRKAAEISAKGHIKLMQQCKPGIWEYQLEALFTQHCLHDGCRTTAYMTIVGGGNNSCTLHYVENNAQLKDGDLVLVDAGGEYKYYAADITRTFPVNGKFNQYQRSIYNIVLEAQKAGIQQVKPGNQFDSVQTKILNVLVQGLIDLGLLTGNLEQLIKNKAYSKFYMHNSGHWLGLDVHDVGKYNILGKSIKFEPGMVVTVEPGLYIANTTPDVDPCWHGIGVRIEDDILVTSSGNEVLSKSVPKEIEEIELLMASI